MDKPVPKTSIKRRRQEPPLHWRKEIESVLISRESIAHRVTVMHQGKVLAEGDMQTVQNNPKVKEVYLGH